MKMVTKFQIDPQSGTAIFLEKGQRLRVIDVEGEQVADLVSFRSNELHERISSARTIDYSEKINFSKGDVLYSNRSNPMLTITNDSVGKHDFLFAPCSQEMFQRTYGIQQPHPNCLDNLSRELKRHGIDDWHIPTAFNIFMNTQINEDGSIQILPPLSKAGDSIEFRAEMDLLVGITACSAGICNNFTWTPIDIEIYEKGNDQ
jgi:uncharacterized protein YcgI (DUF1989 family)